MPGSKPSPACNALFDWPREAGKVGAVLRNMEAKLKQRRRRRWQAGGAAAVALFAAIWGVPYFRSTGTIATPAAQRSSIALADGSTAELNARTALRTDFRYGRRTIELTEGEAFFSVAKDPAHPFLVRTPAGTVRVTGTRFNVRLAAGRAVVTLLEGAVAFEHAGGAIALMPGDQLDSATARPQALTEAQLASELAWRTGNLSLSGLTLAEVAARYATYHGKVIEVAPEVGSLRLGGSCPLDDLPGFFEFIRESADVEVITRRDGAHLIRGR